MSRKAHLDGLISSMLEVAPEIKPEYDRMCAERAGKSQHMSQQDIDELEAIAAKFGFGPLDPEKPGPYIVAEELFMPFLGDLVLAGNAERGGQLMAWVEEMAAKPEPAIKDLVAISLCENFLTRYEDHIDKFYSLMGPHTKAMCIQVMPGFIVSERTRKVFGLP